MVIIETQPFARIRDNYFTVDSFVELAWALHLRPHMGDLIPGTGGVRKVRWKQPGRGKRGGIRVIYFVADAEQNIYLLTAFAKNEASDLPRELLNKMREIIEHE